METKKKRKPIKLLSELEKEQIEQMFLGPYKKAWRDSKGIVINTDSAIAKRLNISRESVSNYTDKLNKMLVLATLKNSQQDESN